MIFAEHIRAIDDAPSLSMAKGNVRHTSNLQGGVERTGGTFDMAIEGDGFFLVETPDGEALTRAGHFLPNAAGELVTNEGNRVLMPAARRSSSRLTRAASPLRVTARSQLTEFLWYRSAFGAPPRRKT